MIELVEIDESNYKEVISLNVEDKQKKFLDTATGIIARGFLYRKQNPMLLAIKRDAIIVGLVLIRDLNEYPECYDFQQLLIDAKYQNQGIGKNVVKIVLKLLEKEKRFDRIDVSIHRENIASLNLFKHNGFIDTGYICEKCKDNINLSYSIK